MKYLNKNFFGVVFGFLSIVAISLLVIAAVSAYAATLISSYDRNEIYDADSN